MFAHLLGSQTLHHWASLRRPGSAKTFVQEQEHTNSSIGYADLVVSRLGTYTIKTWATHVLASPKRSLKDEIFLPPWPRNYSSYSTTHLPAFPFSSHCFLDESNGGVVNWMQFFGYALLARYLLGRHRHFFISFCLEQHEAKSFASMFVLILPLFGTVFNTFVSFATINTNQMRMPNLKSSGTLGYGVTFCLKCQWSFLCAEKSGYPWTMPEVPVICNDFAFTYFVLRLSFTFARLLNLVTRKERDHNFLRLEQILRFKYP